MTFSMYQQDAANTHPARRRHLLAPNLHLRGHNYRLRRPRKQLWRLGRRAPRQLERRHRPSQLGAQPSRLQNLDPLVQRQAGGGWKLVYRRRHDRDSHELTVDGSLSPVVDTSETSGFTAGISGVWVRQTNFYSGD
jgi:hypothetical protein